jgi:hypothetical protein
LKGEKPMEGTTMFIGKRSLFSAVKLTPEETATAESTLAIAKLFGNTEEDLLKYVFNPGELEHEETDEGKIKRLLGVE